MSEPTGENAPKQHEYPYGEDVFLVGIRASDFLYDLCDEIPAWTEKQRWRWLNSDRIAFFNWLNLEAYLPAALTEPGLDEDQISTVVGAVANIHVALPYEEAERHWLDAAYSTAPTPRISSIRQREPEEIVSCGLRRVIDGRDLLRRWWSWRRETDEFRGQGTLDVARETLRELMETVSPTLDLPEPYVKLRAEQQ